MITLYDIPSTIPGKAWSPNTWKARYALNFKRIPYKTTWVEYPSISHTSKLLNALPTSHRADGSPLYTLPMIHDSTTNTVLADSLLIALYLDTTYPDTPPLFPNGTRGLQAAFLGGAHRAAMEALWQLIMPETAGILNEPSRVYFKETKFGPHLLDTVLEGGEREVQFAKLKEGFGRLDEFLSFGKEEGEGGKGGFGFVMGEKATFVDLAMAGYVLWMRKVWGEDSPEWAEVKAWHSGRWAGLLTNLEKYETVL